MSNGELNHPASSPCAQEHRRNTRLSTCCFISSGRFTSCRWAVRPMYNRARPSRSKAPGVPGNRSRCRSAVTRSADNSSPERVPSPSQMFSNRDRSHQSFLSSSTKCSSNTSCRTNRSGHFPRKPRASIIDVLPLLNLRDQRATAMPAFDKTSEWEPVRLCPDIGGAPPIEDLLNRFPDVGRNERLVDALLCFSAPLERACIGPISQQAVNSARTNRSTAFAIAHAGRPGLGCHILQ